jgi:urea transport system substrate-binding protein
LLSLVVGCSPHKPEPIRAGILHSATGSLSSSERPVANATRLALEELAAKGGLLGRPLEIVEADGASVPETFASEAERLIVEQKVDVLFGCWTSASRKAVLPVLERHDHLLFYPLQYEGLEQSAHIVYTGAVPNQQLVPGVKWALDNLGKRFFLVGSDYVYPRAANSMARVQLEVLGAEVVGEEYLLLGSRQVGPVVEKIRRSQPDVILNTINGDTGQAFFAALREAGIRTPTLSTSAGEVEFQAMGKDLPVGHYAVWNYFQSIESPENSRFVQRYKARFGADAVTSDPMEAAYIGVRLWAQAVENAESAEPEEVGKAIEGESLAAPEGLISVDSTTHHCWKAVHVGRLMPDGQFSIVWSSQSPVRPRPFPIYRPASEWESYLRGLRDAWGGGWTNPGPRRGQSPASGPPSPPGPASGPGGDEK